ncbi:MAG: hypothetical protein PGN30_10075 [Mycolicibacterium neoaurum]|uniref:hypothetical protein n=1 Tax=Mycolicibacterium neoaurum TaxID=1795 RepID=UPI002FF87882
MTLSQRFQQVRFRFLAILDSEAVAPLQAVFFAFFIVGAGYLLLFTVAPIESIEKSLGETISNIWAGTLVGGPLTWMIGRRMRNELAYVGLWMQCIGDFITGGAMLVYTSAILSETPWGKGVFSPSISTPTMLCIWLLTFRDIRRIIMVEKRVRQ